MKNKILLVVLTIAFLSVGCKKHDGDGPCKKKKEPKPSSTPTTLHAPVAVELFA